MLRNVQKATIGKRQYLEKTKQNTNKQKQNLENRTGIIKYCIHFILRAHSTCPSTEEYWACNISKALKYLTLTQ